MRLIIVTGLAGSGKSNVLRALEDVGYYCCDNLPMGLVQPFVEFLSKAGEERAALSIDARQSQSLGLYDGSVATLRAGGHSVEVLFIEADDRVLVRRYLETRRRHPLSGQDVGAGIQRDREILAKLRADAHVLDTTGLNVHELKRLIIERYSDGEESIAVTVQSFGFKYGLPADCNIVYDVRFLPNPHFDEELRPQDGRDAAVRDFVLAQPDTESLLKQIEDFLQFALPRFVHEGKLYLSVGIGCTGGRHRSVALAEELQRRLSGDWHVLCRHRDLHRGASHG